MKKFTITSRVFCGLVIPDGVALKIGDYTFLPDFEGEHVAKHIQVEIDANTREEAINISKSRIDDFLNIMSLIDDSQYYLDFPFPQSIQEAGSVTVYTKTLSVKASIVQDGKAIKIKYESLKIKKGLRKTPLKHYRDGINATEVFGKFTHLYKVVEYYLDNTSDLTKWICNEDKGVQMKNYTYKGRSYRITAYSWIRHKLSHSSRNEGVKPLLPSNPADVKLVANYIPRLQKLAREIIRQRDGL